MEAEEKKALCSAVGERVRRHRELLGMTKEQLAEAVGISTQYVSDIEQGKKCMSMSIFVDLSRLFHTSLDELGKGELRYDERIERMVERLMELAPIERDMVADLIILSAKMIERYSRET